MANVNQAFAPSSAGFDNLVRRIIEHPDFKQVVLASPSSSATCSGVVGMAASGSTSAQRNAIKTGESTHSRTPLQEQIFQRRNENALTLVIKTVILSFTVSNVPILIIISVKPLILSKIF